MLNYIGVAPDHCNICSHCRYHDRYYSLNSLKGGYIGDYIGDDYRGY